MGKQEYMFVCAAWYTTRVHRRTRILALKHHSEEQQQVCCGTRGRIRTHTYSQLKQVLDSLSPVDLCRPLADLPVAEPGRWSLHGRWKTIR